MAWNLDKNKPLCPQICEHLCLLIALGEYKPDDRIVSVREAAVTAGVNPNTMQKSYETLEHEGILYSVRGSGWYVADNIDRAVQTLDRLRMEKTETYFADMLNLGMDTNDVKNYIKEWKQ